MQKIFKLFFIIIFVISPWEIKGQQVRQPSSSSVSKTPAAFSVLYNRVLAYPREGGVLSGLLIGIERNALVIRVGKKDEKIPFRNLAKVVIEATKKTSKNALYGMLTGIYLGNLLLYKARNQPAAYMKRIDNRKPAFITLNALFATVGGGLGYLAGAVFEKSERVFNFTGNAQKRQTEWERMRIFITGGTSPKRVHLSIQGGHVFTQIIPQYSNLQQSNDYYYDYGYYYDDGYPGSANNFNLLRKFQLTISTKKNFEIGLAIYWLGEPSLYRVPCTTNTKGYYAVGICKPLLWRLPKGLVWNVGGGLGIAKVNFSLRSTQYSGWPTYETVTTEHNISKTRFSSFVFTELNFFLQDTLSIGLAADYAFVPSDNAPAIPEAGIPAKKLRFSTGSIGFSLGLHF